MKAMHVSSPQVGQLIYYYSHKAGFWLRLYEIIISFACIVNYKMHVELLESRFSKSFAQLLVLWELVRLICNYRTSTYWFHVIHMIFSKIKFTLTFLKLPTTSAICNHLSFHSTPISISSLSYFNWELYLVVLAAWWPILLPLLSTLLVSIGQGSFSFMLMIAHLVGASTATASTASASAPAPVFN